jgi:hypothetical protein
VDEKVRLKLPEAIIVNTMPEASSNHNTRPETLVHLATCGC